MNQRTNGTRSFRELTGVWARQTTRGVGELLVAVEAGNFTRGTRQISQGRPGVEEPTAAAETGKYAGHRAGGPRAGRTALIDDLVDVEKLAAALRLIPLDSPGRGRSLTCFGTRANFPLAAFSTTDLALEVCRFFFLFAGPRLSFPFPSHSLPCSLPFSNVEGGLRSEKKGPIRAKENSRFFIIC